MKKFYAVFVIVILFIFFPLHIEAKGGDKRYCLYKNSNVVQINGGTLIDSIYFIDDGSGKVLVKVNYTGVDGGGRNEKASVEHYNTNLTLADLDSCPTEVCGVSYDIFHGFDPDGEYNKMDKCAGQATFSNYSSGVVGNNSLVFDFLEQTGSANYEYTSWLTGCFERVGVTKIFSIAYDLMKIAAPIMMVLFATVDLAKATASSDEAQIKKAQKHCFKRIIAGVVIFLVLVCIEFVIKLVPDSNNTVSCIKTIFK